MKIPTKTKAKIEKNPTKPEIPRVSEIESIGIELEGGVCVECFKSLYLRYKRPLHLTQSEDSSVCVETAELETCCKHVDSLPDLYWNTSIEIKAWVNIRYIRKLFQFVKEIFESGYFIQNETCGNHLHIKLRDKTKYERQFGTREAWRKFTRAYTDSFEDMKYHNRLLNRYCDASFDPSKIHSSDHNDRYKMINFVSLGERQNTLEFRILPYFNNASEALTSYGKMLNIINIQATEEHRSRKRREKV